MSADSSKGASRRSTREAQDPLTPRRATPSPRTVLPYRFKAATTSATPAAAHAAAARRAQAAAPHRRGQHSLRQLLARVTGGLVTSTRGEPASPHVSGSPARSGVPAAEGLVSDLLPPLSPGHVIRDLPFFTQNAEVQFFSTHPALLDEVFGLAHGQRVTFARGAWAGQRGTVLGARGTSVWVWLAAESIARELPLPQAGHVSAATRAAAADMQHLTRSRGEVVEEEGGGGDAVHAHSLATRVRHRLEEHYGMTVVEPSTAETAGAAQGASGGEEPEMMGSLPAALMRAVEAQVERLYSPEQRAFLQCAPDLYISVVDQDRADPHGRSDSLALGGTPDNASPETDSWRGDEGDGLTFYQRVVGEAVGLLPGRPAAEDDGSGDGLTCRGRTVLLAPLIVPTSGAVGWGGEGVVVVNAGGVHAATASMSAAIVV